MWEVGVDMAGEGNGRKLGCLELNNNKKIKKYLCPYVKSSASLLLSSKSTWYETRSLQNLQSGKFCISILENCPNSKINFDEIISGYIHHHN